MPFRDELDIHADVEPGKQVFMEDVMHDIVRDLQSSSIGEPDLSVGKFNEGDELKFTMTWSLFI